jgi:hypothetical protein
VRNRVAPTAARPRVPGKLVRISVVLALLPAVLMAGTGIAAADEQRAAVDTASVGLAGPVGIAAVVVGFGGLILGLLRHRRRDAVRRPATARRGGRAA